MSENVNTLVDAPAAAEQAQTSEATDNSTENLEQSQEQTAADPDVKAELSKEEKKEEAKLAKKLKKLKIKVDSKEFEEELPFEVDENDKSTLDYLTKQLQLAKMGQKRASEASDLKKKLDQVGEYLQQAKGNPGKIRELMKDLGVDEKQLAAMIVEEEISRSNKSPEQLEKEKLELELKQIKEEREREKKDIEAREFQRMVEAEVQKYDTSIMSAITKFNLPQSPRIVNSFVNYFERALTKGVEVTAEDIAPFVVEDLKSTYKEWIKNSPEDFIDELLGKEGLDKLRKRNLAKAKSKDAPPVPLNKTVVDAGGKKVQKDESNPKISFRDYFKKI